MVTQAELETNLGDYLSFLQENDLDSYLRSPKEYLMEFHQENMSTKKINFYSPNPFTGKHYEPIDYISDVSNEIALPLI
jgi:hypothetical protein